MNETFQMPCPFNGKLCVNGKREDFPKDRTTKERMICPKWTKLVGKNPQNDETIDRYGCSEQFVPILLVEISQMIRTTRESVDKTANEVHSQRQDLFHALPKEAQERIMLNGVEKTPKIEKE